MLAADGVACALAVSVLAALVVRASRIGVPLRLVVEVTPAEGVWRLAGEPSTPRSARIGA
jgi:hypothetical protein